MTVKIRKTNKQDMKASGQKLDISGPTDVKVVSSNTRGLSKMLPAHIFVPMSSPQHDDLYEDFVERVATKKMPCASECASEIATLEQGMSECAEEIPTPFIDDTDL